MVVTNGPEEVAGSAPNRLRINGNIEPDNVPHITIPIIEKNTVNAINNQYCRSDSEKLAKTETCINPIIPKIPPSTNPEITSLRIMSHQSLSDISPNAIALITSVAAWEPELPPLEIISGIKMVNAIAFPK